MSRIIIVRGLPGSGKSTFANSLGCFHVENDFYHVRNGKYKFEDSHKGQSISWCIDMVNVAVMNGIDVVVSNTFVKREYIETYKRWADYCNLDFIVYRMMGKFNNTHNVPNNIKKSMEDGWEDWDGEIFVYPNINFDKYDPVSSQYLTTTFKVGDHVIARRWKGGKDTIHFNEQIEWEEAEAVITEITPASYSYLNIFYKFIDNSKESLAMSGDLKKCEAKHD